MQIPNFPVRRTNTPQQNTSAKVCIPDLDCKVCFLHRKYCTIPRTVKSKQCSVTSVQRIYAPINVMPDPREGGVTWGIDLISLLLGRGFDFI
jgi:hypothetical protein